MLIIRSPNLTMVVLCRFGAKGTFSCIGVDPAAAGAPKACPGWLKDFKAKALAMACTDFSGGATNCWDVIDTIQIHGYARDAQDIKDKIAEYRAAFDEDFSGSGGRKQKTLWLTEVAYGGNDAASITKFIDDLMNPTDGLTNRATYPYVEKVSWFSEWSFDAFTVSGVTPRPFETWSSNLFFPLSGELSPAGTAFFGACNAQRRK